MKYRRENIPKKKKKLNKKERQKEFMNLELKNVESWWAILCLFSSWTVSSFIQLRSRGNVETISDSSGNRYRVKLWCFQSRNCTPNFFYTFNTMCVPFHPSVGSADSNNLAISCVNQKLPRASNCNEKVKKNPKEMLTAEKKHEQWS